MTSDRIVTPAGTHYHPDTDPRVIEVLERMIASAPRATDRPRIRLDLGDVETGRSWLEEWNTTGYVSRSTGPQHVPILVHNARSMGGGAILTHCILRILPSAGIGAWYVHPRYAAPDLAIRPADESGRTWEVVRDGVDVVALLTSRDQAVRYARQFGVEVDAADATQQGKLTIR